MVYCYIRVRKYNLSMATEKQNLEFNKNEDKMKLLISEMEQKLAKVCLGGGKKKIEKHHSKGKLTARERIELLIDKDSRVQEIGAFAGEGMYAEHGGCPSGGFR